MKKYLLAQRQNRDSSQSGINIVDLMMWIVIAAILLAATIQGIGYYRESVILYYLKSDAIGAASNVKSSSAQSQGVINQAVVDTGLTNTRWSDGTTHVGKASDQSTYSITAGNPEITKSVVYCSVDGITVVNNADLPTYTCGGTVVASGPTGGTGGDGTTGTGGGGTTVTGTLAGWGDASTFQLGNGPLAQNTVYGPFHGKTITNLSASGYGGCVLADGVLWCWNRYPPYNAVNQQLSGPLAGKTVTDISVGQDMTCVVADGSVYCWGYNDFGQLGNGTTTTDGSQTVTPTLVVNTGVLSGKTMKSVATNTEHACALDTNNQVYCWGKNMWGELGDGTRTNSNVPVKVSTAGALGGVTVASLQLNFESTCALDTSGYVYCWGFSNSTSTYTMAGPNSVTTPMRSANTGILAGKTFTSISELNEGYCALSDGTQYCWGEIEDAAHNTPSVRMSGFPAGTKVIKSTDSCALLDNGKAYCIYTGVTDLYDYVPLKGSDTVASVSNNPITDLSTFCLMSQGMPWCPSFNTTVPVSNDVTTPITNYPNPVNLNGGLLAGKGLSLISAGGSHSCGVANDATYCWGANWNGQLGDGTTTDAQWPVAVSGLTSGVTALATGLDFSCATTGANTSCWGGNDYGQLGNGTTTASVSPVAVGGDLTGKTVKKIEAGDGYACALDTAGSVYCWGQGGNGQLANGGTSNISSPTLISGSGVLAGKTITDLSVGDYNACVIADGVPYCWGANWDGQLDGTYNDVLSPVATDMSGAIAGKTAVSVAAGNDAFCAIASDNNVYCWGAGVAGELGDGGTDTNYTPQKVTLGGTASVIAAGSNHMCALVGNSVSCWGSDWNGQLGNGMTGATATPPTPATVSDTANVLSGKTIKSLIAGGADTFVLYQ